MNAFEVFDIAAVAFVTLGFLVTLVLVARGPRRGGGAR
jgi:hypothetical protein